MSDIVGFLVGVRNKTASWAPLVLGLIGLLPTPARAAQDSRELPSNVKLLAAMPTAVESVGIVRLAEIVGRDTLLEASFEHWLSPSEPGPDDGFEGWLMPHLVEDGVAVLAYAASDFVAPTGIGAARSNLRTILIASGSFETTLAAFSRDPPEGTSALWPEECPGVCALVADIVERAGSMGVEHPARLFVAFLDSRIVVSSRSEEDLATMVRGLQSSEAAVPEEWRPLAEQAALESSILILRRLLPPMEETGSSVERTAAVEDLSFAAWIEDHDEPSFEVAVETILPVAAARKYFCRWAFETGPGPECGPEWERRGDVFVGETAPLEPEAGHYYVDLVFLFMFGLWLAI